jgi:hypothetical protein
MINFIETIDLMRLSFFFSSLSGNTDPTQYFDVGRMIELAYEEYSDGQLKRINQTGRDLIDLNGKTYESKKVTFTNKNQRAVRGVVVKNGRGSAKDISDFVAADYYIFSDPEKIKACCVPGSMLYNLKKSGSNDITASCDPKHEHFFLYSGPTWNRNYFAEKNDFIMNFIRSVPHEVIKNPS